MSFSLREGEGEGALTALTIAALTVTANDDDADGVADRLTGVGAGAIEQSWGDCYFSSAVHLTLLGKPDQTPPVLRLPGGPLNPLDGVSLVPSESLHGAHLALTSTDKGAPIVPLILEDTVASRIHFTTSQVLPFSSAWQVTGTGLDFVGHPLDLSAAHLSTIADPGYFAQDSFESMPNVALAGNAALIDTSSGLPVPNGKQAFVAAPGQHGHLPLTASGRSDHGVCHARGIERRASGRPLRFFSIRRHRRVRARRRSVGFECRNTSHRQRSLDQSRHRAYREDGAPRIRQRPGRGHQLPAVHRRRPLPPVRSATRRRPSAGVIRKQAAFRPKPVPEGSSEHPKTSHINQPPVIPLDGPTPAARFSPSKALETVIGEVTEWPKVPAC